MVLSDLPLDYKGLILLYGLVSNPEWNWEDGAIYASSIPGGLTQEPPDWSGWVQSIGVAYGADYMLFAPMWMKNLDMSPVMTIAQEGEYKVMTIYVEHVGGKPKLRVDYDLPE